MSERQISFLLQDIAEAVQNIFDFTKDFTLEHYLGDIKTRHAVEHNFMIIGEAVARIPVEYKTGNPHVNWRQVKDFRNVIVHDYFGIDDHIVWEIIQFSLPDLLMDIKALIKLEDN